MQLTRTVGPKGQVVIPKEIRDEFGLRSGSEVEFDVEGKRIVLQNAVAPEAFAEAFFSIGRGKRKHLTTRKLKRLYAEQYEKRMRDAGLRP